MQSYSANTQSSYDCMTAIQNQHPSKQGELNKGGTGCDRRIQVFMDSLVIEGKVGAVAILTRQGKDH